MAFFLLFLHLIFFLFFFFFLMLRFAVVSVSVSVFGAKIRMFLLFFLFHSFSRFERNPPKGCHQTKTDYDIDRSENSTVSFACWLASDNFHHIWLANETNRFQPVRYKKEIEIETEVTYRHDWKMRASRRGEPPPQFIHNVDSVEFSNKYVSVQHNFPVKKITKTGVDNLGCVRFRRALLHAWPPLLSPATMSIYSGKIRFGKKIGSPNAI